MPKTKYALNELGLWLNNELNRRGILLSPFAKAVGITPYYLSYLIRGDNCLEETRRVWKERFQKVLDDWPTDNSLKMSDGVPMSDSIISRSESD